MCACFSPSEETLFEKTGRAVLKRLRQTRSASGSLDVIRDASPEYDRALAGAPASARQKIACRAGCGACCHVPVSAQAHEVLIAAQHVQTHFSPEELDALITRTAAHRAAYAGHPADGRMALRRPCSLLSAGSCSIYVARPGACRALHSASAAACGINLALGREETDVTIPGVRGRMVAVMLAIDHAVAEAGFDGHAYDFGSALHEALTSSSPALRWAQREAAFPVDCREDPDAGDDDCVRTPVGFFQ